jgi:BirA family biotin operon repressor/biotin-[acetyl-CoA-carboxylase] ligase
MANDPRNWPFVASMLVLDEVESTSDHAAQLVRGGSAELPLCVWALRQTRGRGRGTHSWWSDTGSLTFTLAIDPAAHGLAADSEPRLALATAVAVIEAAREMGFDSPELGIRWPNDIQVGDRKLGGLLPERVDGPDGHRLLIGVGLNVSTDAASMPAEVRQMATSLAALRGRAVEPERIPEVLAAILGQFGSVLGRLAARDPDLAARWDALDLLRERWVTVDLGPRTIAGRGRGIDEDGALCLEAGAERHRLFGGQVRR